MALAASISRILDRDCNMVFLPFLMTCRHCYLPRRAETRRGYSHEAEHRQRVDKAHGERPGQVGTGEADPGRDR